MWSKKKEGGRQWDYNVAQKKESSRAGGQQDYKVPGRKRKQGMTEL